MTMTRAQHCRVICLRLLPLCPACICRVELSEHRSHRRHHGRYWPRREGADSGHADGRRGLQGGRRWCCPDPSYQGRCHREIPLKLLLQLLLLLFTTSDVLSSADAGVIGAIVDNTGGAGKEQRVAMLMAVEDFNASHDGAGPTIHVRASQGDPVRAASAALSLVNKQQVDALVGLEKWQEASFIADIGRQAQVPVLSFTTGAPPSASQRWPFLVRVARNQHTQMRAVAAVVGSCRWRRVTILYEDADYASTSIIPHLADALRAVGSEIDRRVPIPESPSNATLQDRLNFLNSSHCRVFVVHTSARIASSLFAEARNMGMMAQGYVWITTDVITSAMDSMDASTIASMQGVVGVRNYFKASSKTRHFTARFKKRFRSEYPNKDEEEEMRRPQYSALLAYDTVWAIASAMENITNTTGSNHTSAPNLSTRDETIQISVSSHGHHLLYEIKKIQFGGMSGVFRFDGDGEITRPRDFQLVNVVGKSYTEIGFWSEEYGFYISSGGRENRSSESMRLLGPVIWPGRPWGTPRGWAPASNNPIKVAVPEKAVFPDFVRVSHSKFNEATFEGFSIDVFKETIKHLPYHLPYKFVQFAENYDSLMGHGHMNSYDILVGDTTISSARYHFVEFSQPYTESGLVMVVPYKMGSSSRSWIFLRPFTLAMWVLVAAIGLYNGIVVWIIERKSNNDYRAGFWNQVSTVFWLSLSMVLSPGERLNSSLSRVVTVVWLFVVLMLGSNYTACLSSLLTAQRLEEPITVESLRSSGATVGCTNGSVVSTYLQEVLLFPNHCIRRVSSDDEYYRVLLSGEIKAAFLRMSHAKLLLNKYCKELMTTGPVYHIAGLGFVLPKGSPLLSDISQAILEVFENGTIQRLEAAMLSAYNCSSTSGFGFGSDEDAYRLSPENFSGLFAVTLFASTAALTVYGVFFHHKGRGGGRRKPSDGEGSAAIDPGGHGAVEAVCVQHSGNGSGGEINRTTNG